MDKQTSGAGLDAVLESYLMAVPEPSYETLIAWVRRYPAYADELTASTVARMTEPFEAQDETADAAALERDLAVARRVLKREGAIP